MSISFKHVKVQPDRLVAGEPAALRLAFAVTGITAFDLDCVIEWYAGSGNEPLLQQHLRGTGLDIAWLPTGTFELTWVCSGLPVPAGDYRVSVSLRHLEKRQEVIAHREDLKLTVNAGQPGTDPTGHWEVHSDAGSPPVDELSWRRGHEDWFYRHFDHASRTIISYLLGDSPLLDGRILDVGCGDGITDLSVFLRCQPKELVGIDPFRGFDRLQDICARNHLHLDRLPPGLRFLPADGNDIPFQDNSFDVVLSWGSLEHIAGGYAQTLNEIKRVLKPDGLLFAHPGLYYSNFGHHLGEFSDEPFFHLTKSREELKDLVLNTEPSYMDRAGEFSTPQQYWQWYTELNPMTVAGFEQELKDLGFDFYRAALRTEDLIEYHHPKLQNYPMQDLATVELYLSAYNRK
ncbi:MAG: class I SAM-dependent methyltransferase [Pseudomonadota bacterium]